MKALLLGGPAHGQFVTVADTRSVYKVPRRPSILHFTPSGNADGRWPPEDYIYWYLDMSTHGHAIFVRSPAYV